MRPWFIIIIGILFLTGCAQPFDSKLLWSSVTPEEQAINDRQAAEVKAKAEEARIQDVISRHRPMCTQLGFKEGTPDFGNCVLRLNENEENLAAQDKASRRAAPNTTTNCYSSGNSINCSSY